MMELSFKVRAPFVHASAQGLKLLWEKTLKNRGPNFAVFVCRGMVQGMDSSMTAATCILHCSCFCFTRVVARNISSLGSWKGEEAKDRDSDTVRVRTSFECVGSNGRNKAGDRRVGRGGRRCGLRRPQPAAHPPGERRSAKLSCETREPPSGYWPSQSAR